MCDSGGIPVVGDIFDAAIDTVTDPFVAISEGDFGRFADDIFHPSNTLTSRDDWLGQVARMGESAVASYFGGPLGAAGANMLFAAERGGDIGDIGMAGLMSGAGSLAGGAMNGLVSGIGTAADSAFGSSLDGLSFDTAIGESSPSFFDGYSAADGLPSDIFEGLPAADISMPSFDPLAEAALEVATPTGVDTVPLYEQVADSVAQDELGGGLAGIASPAPGPVDVFENTVRSYPMSPSQAFPTNNIPWQQTGAPVDGMPSWELDQAVRQGLGTQGDAAIKGLETPWYSTVGAPTSGTPMDWSNMSFEKAPEFLDNPVGWIENAASNQWDAIKNMSGKDLAMTGAKGLGGLALMGGLRGVLGGGGNKAAPAATVQKTPSKYFNTSLPTYGYVGATTPTSRIRNRYGGDITKYGAGPAHNFFSPQQMVQMAEGGSVRGPGGPTDDKIPAMLSDGEFVVPTDVVNSLGGGNNSRGAGALHQMMAQARKGKRGRRS